MRNRVLERFEEGMVVEIAGLLRDTTLNGMKGVCSGRSETNADRVTAVLCDGLQISRGTTKSMLYSQSLKATVRQWLLRGPEGVPEQGPDPVAQFDAHAPRCEICAQPRETSDWHKPASDDAKPPDVHMDFQFTSDTGTFRDKPWAKATMPTLVDTEIGNGGVVQVHGKSPDASMIRYTAAFLDRERTEKVRLRYDTEPAVGTLAEKVAACRHQKVTIPTSRAEHQSAGAAKRTHKTLQAGVRALRLDNLARLHTD